MDQTFSQDASQADVYEKASGESAETCHTGRSVNLTIARTQTRLALEMQQSCKKERHSIGRPERLGTLSSRREVP